MSDTKRVPPINLTYSELQYVMALAFRGEPPNDAQLETDPNYELYHSVQDKFETADTRANRYSGTDIERSEGSP